MFFGSVFSPRNVFDICSIMKAQWLLIASTINLLSPAERVDCAISTHCSPFLSIQILAVAVIAGPLDQE